MKKTLTNNRYEKIKYQSGFLAKACECSISYVNKVLKGDRVPKTARAGKAQLVLEKADQLLEILNRPAPYNTIL